MAEICEKGGSGLVLPLFGDSEHDWPRGLRIVLYLLGLFYCFAGVAIIADVFMAAIEKVTSRKLRLYDAERQRHYTFEVWNATVANLTLMALGSSAPEILLNVIDIFAKEFYLEGLGPGTIVGSAAFNLEMIIAVCILAIPSGQVRYIKEMGVYAITAVWSIFAYVWLLIILLLISPNVVEIWEGVMTFIFFPILVTAAWAADKGYFGSSKAPEKKCGLHAEMTEEEIAEMESNVRKEHGEHLTNEQVARYLEAMQGKTTSRAAYRIGATRAMFGGKRVKFGSRARHSISNVFSGKFAFSGSKSQIVPTCEEEAEPPSIFVSFSCRHYVVFENVGKVKLKVVRKGNETLPVRIHYTTSDGTAKAGEDYKVGVGWVDMPANETEAFIEVEIIDDKTYESSEDFSVLLVDAKVQDSKGGKTAIVTSPTESQVTIIDNDDAGIIGFESDHITINAPQVKDSEERIVVRRRGGGCGEVSVRYEFEGDSAVKGRDFDGDGGRLEFVNGQMESYLSVNVKAVSRLDSVDKFRIVLSDPQGGCRLDPGRDGGPDKNILTVMIEGDRNYKDRIHRMKSLLQVRWDKSQVGHANWASQFKDAITVNGGDDDDDCEPPSTWDKISHFITLPWKLFFALVPPVDYCGGWVCFFSALLMIGVVTMLIGDMASLLGCVLCLPDDVTAISFVALGTSLPDTFASKTAAEQDPHADASVGNVTGSNCVNVFLGLGLPWMIAAFYWSSQSDDMEWQRKYSFRDGLDWLGPKGDRSQGFVVEAGSLGFSVAVFSVCACVTLLLLAVRRWLFGGELGGPAGPKWASAVVLVFLWVLYISLSAAKSISERGGISCAG